VSPDFLTLDDVLELHELQVDRYGGLHGVRDQGLIESAIAQPEATFAGEYLHGDLFEMAAAYLFHLVRNHGFLDGNKRTGLLTALVFLDINGISVDQASPDLYELTVAVAEGRADKDEAAAVLRRVAQGA